MALRLGRRDGLSLQGWDHYVDHAAIGPMLDVARDAVLAGMHGLSAGGIHGFHALIEGSQRSKAQVGSLLGVAPDTLAWVDNTDRGVQSIALCHPWEPGDTVVLLEGEFPANTTPWQRAAELFDLKLEWLSAESFETSRGLEELEAVLRRTRRGVVAVSAVQFQTGLRMPLREMADLAHSYDAALAVDAIQACSAVELPIDAIDYLASGGQKWLCAGPGTGFVYASSDRWRALRPNMAGWLSHDDAFGFLFGDRGKLTYDRGLAEGPTLFEPGTPGLLAVAALGEAAEALAALGPATVHEHVQQMLDPLESGLVELGFTSRRAADPARRSNILSLRPPEGWHPGEIANALTAERVSVTTPDGHVRFSPHWHNDVSEVDSLLAAVRRVVT